jgi:hypothetical protein
MVADLDFRTGHLDGKYKVAMADGSPVPPDAAFFVLRLDSDPHARKVIEEHRWAAALEGANRVEKADGRPTDPEARYVALRIDAEPRARRAVMTYAESIAHENKIFALEICSWLWEFVPAAGCGCREAGCGHMGPESWPLAAAEMRVRRTF